ncbi:unnamed protein product [Lactuca saligna]|uniref:Uncharacterized protein n=1 Tax=Lactuca saligna TaxID=75948 RepID=A0AA36A0T5_LACSI|nr:unnamed protein product [Lactuca saligna]
MSQKILEDPPLEKENPKGLSATNVFQQKIFGFRLGCFMASTTESSVVIPITIPLDTTTGNEEPVETKSLDTEVSILNPPPSTGYNKLPDRRKSKSQGVAVGHNGRSPHLFSDFVGFKRLWGRECRLADIRYLDWPPSRLYGYERKVP